jgi:phosphoglycerol transferase MdoB-like AlkP superfamily enzyme
MKRIIDLFFRYLGFWVIYFIVIRFLFILYHIKPFSEEKFTDIISTFIYGFRMDLSMAAYFSLLPFLIMGLLVFRINPFQINKLLKCYSITILVISSFLVVVDMELFSFWGYRLDGTPLKYLNTPGEMIVSSLSSPWYILIPVFILLIIVFAYVYKKLVEKRITETQEITDKKQLLHYGLSIVLAATLILPLRGGWQQIPINESTVYFTSSNLANQTAVNLPWTFIHSLLEKSYSDTNPYEFTDYNTANKIVKELYTVSNDSTVQVLNSKNANVLIILWESFTSKADVDSVTPEFNKLKEEGLFFNSIYATGDRSDKGIVGVLSGYPALPVTSIILNPNKSLKLPSLVKRFSKKGYNSSFYYGGELAFANMNSYLVQNKFLRTISKEDFEKKDMNSKWGAHDEVVYKRLKTELDTMRTPFFSMIFTLTSHEPFEIPAKPKFEGNDKASMFLSSLNYSDKCLGDFIAMAKKTSWWENTLIVIIADHGHVLPGNYYASHKKSEFRIPMLWLGGALKVKDSVITKIASQSDLAATLMAQLLAGKNNFAFSRNILSPAYKESAYYSFNNGFGYITPEGFICLDNVSGKFISRSEKATEQMVKEGKAIQQVTFKDYLDK